jgi:hypothetical protein
MRLTLRTLLAWLDDTLPPAEVREIGKQVSESLFAKELVDRIHKVTRMRRLTVPSQTGADATDPNLVASYLDNELGPEEVAEFEKRCLTSDVHLSEVASVHQILSLIGQKAKVPTEARHRMYHLIRGREAVAATAPRASQATEPTPVSEPLQPWVTPEPPRRPWYERYGPAAAMVALMLVLFWTARQSLKPPEPTGRGPVQVAKAEPTAAAKQPAKPAVAAEVPSAKTDEGPAPPAEAEKEPKPAPEKTAADEAPPDLPPGMAGLAHKPEGILLQFNRDSREWKPVTADTPLRDQDRLLSLAPFRSTITLGKARVDLVNETELWVLSAPPTQAARVSLAQGRVVLHGISPAAPFAIQFAGKTVEVTPPPGASVGLERINRREPGSAVAATPVLRIYAAEGTVDLLADDAKETLSGPAAITYDLRGPWAEKSPKLSPPSWVTEAKPKPFDVQVGEQFARPILQPGRPLMSEIVAATEDDQKDVRRLAIAALRAVGDISYVVPLLSKPENPVSRREAIKVLRDYMAQSPDAEKDLRSQLVVFYGADLADTVEKLLIGFSPKDAREESTYNGLVQELSSTDVGVRELALDNLQSLTGRDDLGYDPDKPEGKGLKAWKDLLHNHELRPAASAPPRAESAPPRPRDAAPR